MVRLPIHEKSVRRTQVPDGPQGYAVQDLHMGQKLVGCHKEGNFQQQGDGAVQGIGGPIMVLPVIGLQNHHPLVAGEGFLDMGHALPELCLRIPGFLLHGIRPPVQGQDQDVHDQAQDDDGKAGMADELVGNGKDDLKEQLQRPDEQGFQNRKK